MSVLSLLQSQMDRCAWERMADPLVVKVKILRSKLVITFTD